MGEIWFTSDTHFFHRLESIYRSRGFDSETEMNEAIVARWNSVVRPGDTVYHLGDVLMGDYDAGILDRLNGDLMFLRGNHDTRRKLEIIAAGGKGGARAFLGDKALLRLGGLSLYLCHYPVEEAGFDALRFEANVIKLHGHRHQKENWLFYDNPFVYHVGLDSHACYPVHFETVVRDIRHRWNALDRPVGRLYC